MRSKSRFTTLALLDTRSNLQIRVQSQDTGMLSTSRKGHLRVRRFVEPSHHVCRRIPQFQPSARNVRLGHWRREPTNGKPGHLHCSAESGSRFRALAQGADSSNTQYGGTSLVGPVRKLKTASRYRGMASRRAPHYWPCQIVHPLKAYRHI
jgi:hypothetical protein